VADSARKRLIKNDYYNVSHRFRGSLANDAGHLAIWGMIRAPTRSLCNDTRAKDNRTMGSFWWWWIAAAVLIGAELVTGTFYVLAVGIAAALGGVAAWMGFGLAGQFAVAGVLGVVLTGAAHHWRLSRAMPAPEPGFDVGQLVHVNNWNDDGTARVAYRGSTWDAELESPTVPRTSSLYICATRGSVLILTDRRPAA
jgi:membrane protein implicated in regulation of membrane protease activity